MEILHPTSDPSLVSYHRPELISLLPSLEIALDCWNLLDTNGRGAAKKKYLLKEPAEPKAAYEHRIHRSTYTPVYRDSIRAYAGLLNRFQPVGLPPSMMDAQANVDLQGSSLQSFWNRCDEMALRDGGVFVMIDMLPETDATNFIDQQNDGRRPYLIMIERKDVINWSVEYKNGREFINHVTVRQMRSMPAPSGYGVQIEPVYYVLRPNSVDLYRLEKKDGAWMQVKMPGWPVQTSLPVVPLIWYGSATSKFAQGDLPMNGLAELSLQHYQMRSDLHELLHKCAMPVPVRKGAPVGADGNYAPLVLGPNTAVDLPGEGGDFEFAEPSGRSIERHQAEVQHVEMLMDRCGLNFLYGANIKTATEASLRASQVASQIAALVRNKVSSFKAVMRLWAAYAGEFPSITPESGIAINDSLINRPLDPSGIAQMVNLFNADLLSRRTVLDELQRGGVIDPDLIVDDEEARIEKDTAAAMKKQEKMMQRAELVTENPRSTDMTKPPVAKPPTDSRVNQNTKTKEIPSK